VGNGGKGGVQERWEGARAVSHKKRRVSRLEGGKLRCGNIIEHELDKRTPGRKPAEQIEATAREGDSMKTFVL